MDVFRPFEASASREQTPGVRVPSGQRLQRRALAHIALDGLGFGGLDWCDGADHLAALDGGVAVDAKGVGNRVPRMTIASESADGGFLRSRPFDAGVAHLVDPLSDEWLAGREIVSGNRQSIVVGEAGDAGVIAKGDAATGPMEDAGNRQSQFTGDVRGASEGLDERGVFHEPERNAELSCRQAKSSLESGDLRHCQNEDKAGTSAAMSNPPKKKVTRPRMDPVEQENRATGARLAWLRAIHGMSQAECGRAFGITQSAWSRYELGERTLDPHLAVRIAGRFRVTIGYLYQGQMEGVDRLVARELVLRHAEPGSPNGTD